MRDQFKDVPMGEHTYRISLVDSSDGAWLYTKFTTRYRDEKAKAIEAAATSPAAAAKVQEVPSEEALAVVRQNPEIGFLMTAGFLIESLTREEYREVQMLCLSQVGRLEEMAKTMVPTPVIVNGNQWNPEMAELEYDGPTCLALVKYSLAFNLAPFFPAAGSNGQPKTQAPAPTDQNP